MNRRELTARVACAAETVRMRKLAEEMHFRGFVDTCERYGIEKDAAARIYKKAGWGWVGTALQGAGSLLGKIKPLANIGKKVGGWFGRAKGGPIGATATILPAAGGAPGAAARASLANAAARRAAQSGVNAAAGAAAKAKPGMMQRWGNFAQKHPRLATLGIIAPTVMATNMANGPASQDEYNEAPTLTPSEETAFNRMNTGYGLPGLGLDPSYFDSTRRYI